MGEKKAPSSQEEGWGDGSFAKAEEAHSFLAQQSRARPEKP